MISQVTAKLKDQLRAQIRNTRQQLTETELKQADLLVAQQYLQTLDKFNFQKIALYLHHDNELATSELINFLLDRGCQLYIPKLYADDNHQFHFCRYDRGSDLVNNRYGIPEPVIDDFISIDDLELILLPLTAFDLQGNRLGMGGGYYDRALARRTHDDTMIVGLAHDCQEVTKCPVEPFDQSLQMIITPTRVIDFRK